MSAIKAIGVAVILNGQPVGNLLQTANYNQHGFADVKTKAISRHIPHSALQRWDVKPGSLTITTDQFFGSGFEACPC